MATPAHLEVLFYKFTHGAYDAVESADDDTEEANMPAKRAIETETDVYAMIWSCRRAGEETENEILRRVLVEYLTAQRLQRNSSANESYDRKNLHDSKQREFSSESLEVKNSGMTRVAKGSIQEIEMTSIGKIRWVDDVFEALRTLGGRGALLNIYREVERRRRAGQRSVPKTLEATIRRTLEDHSSDSKNFRGEDLFSNTERGEWAIRKTRKS